MKDSKGLPKLESKELENLIKQIEVLEAKKHVEDILVDYYLNVNNEEEFNKHAKESMSLNHQIIDSKNECVELIDKITDGKVDRWAAFSIMTKKIEEIEKIFKG